jgi:hypothetical protein
LDGSGTLINFLTKTKAMKHLLIEILKRLSRLFKWNSALFLDQEMKAKAQNIDRLIHSCNSSLDAIRENTAAIRAEVTERIIKRQERVLVASTSEDTCFSNYSLRFVDENGYVILYEMEDGRVDCATPEVIMSQSEHFKAHPSYPLLLLVSKLFHADKSAKADIKY